jgi:hypothetical protein
MRALSMSIGLVLTLIGSMAQASSNQGATAATLPTSSSYQRPGRSAFFLPPPDPAEIRRCALPKAILNSASKSACGNVHRTDAHTSTVRRNSA